MSYWLHDQSISLLKSHSKYYFKIVLRTFLPNNFNGFSTGSYFEKFVVSLTRKGQFDAKCISAVFVSASLKACLRHQKAFVCLCLRFEDCLLMHRFLLLSLNFFLFCSNFDRNALISCNSVQNVYPKCLSRTSFFSLLLCFIASLLLSLCLIRRNFFLFFLRNTFFVNLFSMFWKEVSASCMTWLLNSLPS